MAATLAAAAQTIDLPPRKAGQWEVRMVTEKPASGPSMHAQMCIDAATDRDLMDFGLKMSKDSCKRYDVKRAGAAWVIDAECTFGPVKSTTKTTISGDFQSTVTVRTEGTTEGFPGAGSGPQPTLMTQTARWVGRVHGRHAAWRHLDGRRHQDEREAGEEAAEAAAAGPDQVRGRCVRYSDPAGRSCGGGRGGALLLRLVEDLDGLGGRLGGKRLAGDGEAALGVGAHLVQGGLVRAADLLAVGAGLGAGVDLRSARRDGAVGGGAHLVERRLADARGRRRARAEVGAVGAGPMSSAARGCRARAVLWAEVVSAWVADALDCAMRESPRACPLHDC